MASCEGLNLLQQPPYNASIVSRTDTEYYPSNMTPDNNKESISIDVINKSKTDFIDLTSTEILSDLQICDTTDKSAITTTMAAAKYGICNKFGQALFKQMTLQEGDIEMNNSTGTYPYQVDFENRVTYDERDLEGRPRLKGCIPDTASSTALARTHATQATQNAGLFVRSALFDNGKRVQVLVKPHLGPLAQTRYLLPKTRITIWSLYQKNQIESENSDIGSTKSRNKLQNPAKIPVDVPHSHPRHVHRPHLQWCASI